MPAPEPPLVFEIIRDSQCSECGAELGKGSLLKMEGKLPLCMACADMAELVYLPAGNTALTRRSGKHSSRKAVVVRFSRARNRYERQGILVEADALALAERECLDDAGERAEQRARSAVQRRKQDRRLVVDMAERIRTLFPGCPEEETKAIAAHAAVRGSGRVGRSAAGQNLEEDALTLAVVAAIRHRQTDYDHLLARGMERGIARRQVAGKVDEILSRWRRAAVSP